MNEASIAMRLSATQTLLPSLPPFQLNFLKCRPSAPLELKLLYKSPPVSLVTKRLIKLVRVFSRKPRIQRHARYRFLREVLFCRSNQRATNSAAARCRQCHKSKDSPGWIVMFVAWMCDRADHSADFSIDLRKKGPIPDIA